MESDLLSCEATVGKLNFFFFDKISQEVAVVDHFEISPKVRIFIFKGIIIVRACGKDLFHIVHTQGFDNHQGLHLKKHFIPCTACYITTIDLLCS